MKTIFISIFEGVEAKNILRTPILKTLLQEPDVRIVLFTKSEERVAYYKKTFDDPRFFYEVVKRKPVRGLDAIFSKLKFTLLRTSTTDIKRRLALATGGNFLVYFLSLILNRIIAHRLVRKIARKLDFIFIRDHTYDRYFESYKPDLVFLAHLFDEPEIDLLRAAKKRKVKTIGFINSWDKITARCIIRLLPNKFIVFNDIVKGELIEHNEVNESDIFVSGLPQYDCYANPDVLDRNVFLAELGFDADIKRVIVYAPNGRYSDGVDGEMIELLLSFMKEGLLPSDLGLLIRFQPNDFVDQTKLRKLPRVLYQIPGIRFSSERGVDWDMDANDINLLVNTLYHSSLFVCYTSSLSVDAAVFDKPIININFELHQSNNILKSPTIFYKMEHYKNVIETGGIRVVESKQRLLHSIGRYLEDPSEDHEGRARLVREQCSTVDGRAGERVGNFILKFLHG